MHLLRRVVAVYPPAILAALRADWVIYAALVIYLCLGALDVALKSGTIMGALDVYMRMGLVTYLVTMPMALLVLGITRITLRLDRRRRLAYRLMFGPRRIARLIAGTVLMVCGLLPFEAMFASIKSTFLSGGFANEPLAAAIDRFLHFGHAPSKYLLLFAKSEWVLRAVEYNYDFGWFIICFGTLYWFAISPKAERLRLRFCLSFFAVWVLVGNVVASLFATAGPAFYGEALGDTTHYDKLTAFLATSSGSVASASDEQHYLWTLYAQGIQGFGSGISAFPSIHVAVVALIAMFATAHNRKLGIVAWLYVILVLASSVYLGWHYAIDGYAALLLTTGIYFGVGALMPAISRLANWRPRPRAIEDAPVPALAIELAPPAVEVSSA